jgi:LCP family protein required for cell wall assembly
VSEFRDRSSRQPAGVTVARHGRLSRSAAWKTVIAVLGATVAVALVAVGSVAAIAVNNLHANIKTVSIGADKDGPPPSIGAMKGGFNILLAGSDTREGQGGIGGTVRDDGGNLNDVTMLMHVAHDQKSATVVSIPRDMVVPIPKCSKGGPATGLPINTTLSYGGLPCTVATVENLTGLKIQFAGLITFQGVIAMSDAVGGVDVCVNAPIHDPYTGLNLPKAGTYTLKGWSALAFLRSRHGVGDGSDLGRISNQQVFLSALVRKIKDGGVLGNPLQLYPLAKAAVNNMTVSDSLENPSTLVQIALALKNIDLSNVVFLQYPVVTDPDDVNRVIPDDSAAEVLTDALNKDQPVKLTGTTGRAAELAPGSTPAPSDTGAPAAPAPGDTAAPAPTSAPTSTGGPVELPSSIQGQTAAQQTCSKGNN